MFNPYVIILSLFTLTGLITALCGLFLLHKARLRRNWPATMASIEHAHEGEDPTLRVFCNYVINGKTYRHEIKMAEGTPPGQEFVQAHLEKFPADTTVPVYCDPAQPENMTLDKSAGRDDWLIFAAGLAAALFGIGALFLSN